MVLGITAPADGLLRIEIEERGISTVSLLNDARGSESASPVDRLGTAVLATDVRRDTKTRVRIRAEDSHGVHGEVCVTAELLPSAAPLERRAELAFAAAGRATRATDWATAFTRFLGAARDFDALGAHRRAAMARHAMAELAYLRFDRKRDAYALAGEAFKDYGNSADRALLGELGVLEAKTLLDMPGEDIVLVASEVRRWLDTGRRLEKTVAYGAREIPRIDILQGFLEFLLEARAQSHRYFTLAAERCYQLQDWDCYAVASQNMAALAEEEKNYSAASSTYTQTLRLLPADLDPKLSADIWNNLGRVQGIMGLFSASERSHDSAMRAYAKLGDCQGIRRSLARVGNLLAHVGNLADAENDLARAASWSCPSLLASTTAATASSTDPAATAHDLGGRDSRDPNEATTRQACARPLDPTSLTLENKAIVFNSVLSLGNAAMLAGDLTSAWHCLDAAQSYAADSRSQIRLANALGIAFLERGNPQDARTAFARALRLADDAGLPPTHELRSSAQLGLVKSLLLAGQATSSLPGAFEALRTSTARGDIESTITSLRLIAAGYRGSGRQDTAIHVLGVAADLIEAVPIDELNGEQRAEFLASQHTVFAELTDLLASRAGTDDAAAWTAFEASERGRARSLRYALNLATQDAATTVDAPSAAMYPRLLSELANIKVAGGPGPTALAGIDAIDRLAQSGAGEPFARASLARTLQQLNATLIEYASGPKEMLAFVVTGTRVRVVHLGDTAAIKQATTALQERLRDAESPASEVQAAAQALARVALWPITADLPDGRLVIVPEDALHTVPLSILPWTEAAGRQLVLQHAETTVIPSALFLMHIHSGVSVHSASPRIALIGDPFYRVADWRRECIDMQTAAARQPPGPVERALGAWTESLPRLPGTRAEVNGIAKLAREARPASRVETLVGCAAVPAALRKAASTDVDLLHIATHARIDAQRPRLSALALTPVSASDASPSTFGLLDILGLKLNARLVVLSACDTSRGQLLPGEGVLGPAQAFLQAGSAAVLASYWRVDDQVTAAFMQRFYKYLLVDRLSAATALRRAQLDEATAAGGHEWAAFSLYGWPDSTI